VLCLELLSQDNQMRRRSNLPVLLRPELLHQVKQTCQDREYRGLFLLYRGESARQLKNS
jgi:hypothetical protein